MFETNRITKQAIYEIKQLQVRYFSNDKASCLRAQFHMWVLNSFLNLLQGRGAPQRLDPPIIQGSEVKNSFQQWLLHPVDWWPCNATPGLTCSHQCPQFPNRGMPTYTGHSSINSALVPDCYVMLYGSGAGSVATPQFLKDGHRLLPCLNNLEGN